MGVTMEMLAEAFLKYQSEMLINWSDIQRILSSVGIDKITQADLEDYNLKTSSKLEFGDFYDILEKGAALKKKEDGEKKDIRVKFQNGSVEEAIKAHIKRMSSVGYVFLEHASNCPRYQAPGCKTIIMEIVTEGGGEKKKKRAVTLFCLNVESEKDTQAVRSGTFYRQKIQDLVDEDLKNTERAIKLAMMKKQRDCVNKKLTK